jgi:hypothetical protein
MSKKSFFVEVTDTFGDEANYSWVTRHKITASSERGAMRKVGRYSGLSWHCVDKYSDSQRWDSESGATCAFIELFDESTHAHYTINTL